MKQIIRYSGTKPERMDKALADAKAYLGTTMYDSVMSLLLDCLQESGIKSLVSTYKLNFSMLGIEGAPARAMMLEGIRQYKRNRV